MSEGEARFPAPAIGIYVDSLQAYLHTAVQNRTNVGDNGAATCFERELNCVEEVRRNLIVEVNGAGDAVSEETEVKTSVPLARSLPREVLIYDSIGEIACFIRAAERIVRRIGENLLGSVVANTGVVTGETIRKAPLQVGEPFSTLHPVFF